jgi:hypothetical protein
MPEPADDRLGAELRDLAAWLTVPPAPDVTTAVRERLAAPARPRTWRRWWRWLAAALAAALVVGAVPPARAAVTDAVAGALRFAGVEVRRDGPRPAASPRGLPAAEPVDLAGARAVARFPVRVPAALGQPEQVVVADPDPGGAPRVVSLRWRGGTVVLDEFDGQVDIYFAKTAPDATWVDLDGRPAWWFPTGHPVVYVDRAGITRTETARLAGPTLIWVDTGVTYRLEGLPTLDEAVATAKT